MTKNISKIKLVMSVGSLLLWTSELSVGSEEHIFEFEFAQRCGQNMQHINDAIGAQSALHFLSDWVGSDNLIIKQKTLQAAETLIKKWELDPPSWFSGILPQAQATAEQIYEEVSSHTPNEPHELAEIKDELKDVIEAEVLHTRVPEEGQEEKRMLAAILSESLVKELLEEQKTPEVEVQQQGEEVRRKHEAEMEVKHQVERRTKARQKLDKKIEEEQQVEKKEQEQRHKEAEVVLERQRKQKEQEQKLEAEHKLQEEEQERREQGGKSRR